MTDEIRSIFLLDITICIIDIENKKEYLSTYIFLLTASSYLFKVS